MGSVLEVMGIFFGAYALALLYNISKQSDATALFTKASGEYLRGISERLESIRDSVSVIERRLEVISKQVGRIEDEQKRP